MKNNTLFLSICSLCVFSAGLFAQGIERTYVGKFSYCSFDDPNSWDVTTGGEQNTYSWTTNDTFVFDKNKYPDAVSVMDVKYFKQSDQPVVNKLILKTAATFNGVAAKTADSTEYRANFTANAIEVYTSSTATNFYFNRFGKISAKHCRWAQTQPLPRRFRPF